MKLKAKDTLFISSVSSENILPGATFEVSDAQGKGLVERGLATQVKGKGAAKAAAAPKNKMQPTTLNKAPAKAGK